MKTSTRSRRELSRSAERQMRMWSLGIESNLRLEKERTAPKNLIHPYIAISRESGVDAAKIAQLIAAQTGWAVLDREILDYMAENYKFSRIALEFVDERTASWFHEIFGKLLDRHLVSQAEYVSRLGRVVLMAAQHESTIFVVRGAQFVLPRDVGLSVRIIDLKQQRIKRIIDRQGLSPGAASKFIEETDEGRANFVQRYFHRDVGDPHLYDLVISLERMSHDAAAEIIPSDCKRRFGPSGFTSQLLREGIEQRRGEDDQ